jgi:hypothetical protein
VGEVSIWDRGTYRCEKWQREEIIVIFEGSVCATLCAVSRRHAEQD